MANRVDVVPAATKTYWDAVYEHILSGLSQDTTMAKKEKKVHSAKKKSRDEETLDVIDGADSKGICDINIYTANGRELYRSLNDTTMGDKDKTPHTNPPITLKQYNADEVSTLMTEIWNFYNERDRRNNSISFNMMTEKDEDDMKIAFGMVEGTWEGSDSEEKESKKIQQPQRNQTTVDPH
jgi:hypothetical protein